LEALALAPWTKCKIVSQFVFPTPKELSHAQSMVLLQTIFAYETYQCNEGKSTASFCCQEAAWLPDMLSTYI